MANRKRKYDAQDASPPVPKRTKQANNEDTKFRIPQHLKSSITQISRNRTDRVFTMKFSMGSMDSMRKLAWGLRDSATSIGIRVKFHDRDKGTLISFCVHNSGDRRPASGHRFCLSKDGQPNKVICTPRPNILTCTISCALHEFVRSNQASVTTIHQTIDAVINSDPTAKCLICHSNIGVKVWTATTCSGQCAKKLEAWRLPARLSHLAIDFRALDLLLCCVYTLALRKTESQLKANYQHLLSDYPIAADRITSLIDSFPDSFPDDLSKVLSSPDARSIKQTNALEDRQKLLSWICSKFRGCLTSLPKTANFHIPGIRISHQFSLLNSHSQGQKSFEQKLGAIKSNSGQLAFHGTPSINAFSILSDGLKPNRIGLFYAPEPHISMPYAARAGSDGFLQPWKKSAYYGAQYLILLGCEVSRDTIPWRIAAGKPYEHSTFDANTVMIRYIFLCPVGKIPPSLSAMRSKMVSIFTTLDKGQLKPRDIK